MRGSNFMVSLEEGKSKRGNRKVRGTLGVREKNSVLQSNEMKLKKKYSLI